MCKFNKGFSEIEKIYTAIKDIDRLRSTDQSDLLDDVWNVIKDIDKKQFSPENTDIIINTIRDSLITMYLTEIRQAEEDINLSVVERPIKENFTIVQNAPS